MLDRRTMLRQAEGALMPWLAVGGRLVCPLEICDTPPGAGRVACSVVTG